MNQGDDRVLLLVERDLPHPVSDVVAVVDHSVGILGEVGACLVHVERAFRHCLELVALDVAEYRPVAFVDVEDIEVEPVGHLVVRMSGGIGQIDFVLAVALVLGIGSCARRLHDLLGSEVYGHVVLGVGHGDACDRRMPVDTAPAEVDVCGVIAEDEGGRIGGVVLHADVFLLAKL